MKRFWSLFAILTLTVIGLSALAISIGTQTFQKLPPEDRVQYLAKFGFQYTAFYELIKSVDEDPKLIKLHYWATHLLRNHPKYAQKYYKSAINHELGKETDEYMAPYFYGLGYAYFYEGNFKKAKETAETLNKLWPENVFGKLLLANTFAASGNRDDIHAGLMQLLDIHSKHAYEDDRHVHIARHQKISQIFLTYIKLREYSNALAWINANEYFLSAPSNSFYLYSAYASLLNFKLVSFFKNIFKFHVWQENFLTFFILSLNSGVFWLFIICLHDIYEPEPIGLIVKAFFCSLIATLFVPGLYFILDGWIHVSRYSPFPGNFLLAFFIGLIEEGTKLFIILMVVYKNREFDEAIDGIIYAAAVALGFACLENFHYVEGSGLAVYPSRFFAASIMHLFLTGIMGYFVSLQKFKLSRLRFPIFWGFCAAVSCHALYDFFIFNNAWYACLALFLFIAFLFFYCLRKSQKQSVYSHLKPRSFHVKHIILGAILIECLLVVGIASIIFGLTIGSQVLPSIVWFIIYAALGSGVFLVHLLFWKPHQTTT